MTDFQKRAKEAARTLEICIDASQEIDCREAYERWVVDFGPTALAALRAVAGGQEAWQHKICVGEPPVWFPREPLNAWRPVLIVEEPNE